MATWRDCNRRPGELRGADFCLATGGNPNFFANFAVIMRETGENIPQLLSGDASRGSATSPWEPQPEAVPRNHYATAALACSVLTALLGWVPVLGWVLWLAAIAFSLIGLTRAPRWSAYLALVLTAAITVVALLFAVVGSRAVHSFFSFMAEY